MNKRRGTKWSSCDFWMKRDRSYVARMSCTRTELANTMKCASKDRKDKKARRRKGDPMAVRASPAQRGTGDRIPAPTYYSARVNDVVGSLHSLSVSKRGRDDESLVHAFELRQRYRARIEKIFDPRTRSQWPLRTTIKAEE